MNGPEPWRIAFEQRIICGIVGLFFGFILALLTEDLRKP